MNRRRFIQNCTLSAVGLWLPHRLFAKPIERTVEVVTTFNVDATGEVWVPLPLGKTSYQEVTGLKWSGFTNAAELTEPVYKARVLHATLNAATPASLTYRVKLRDRSNPEKPQANDSKLFLQPTKHVPTDGIVKETADKIVGATKGADEKARRVYDWVVDNTQRDPKVRGCGVGDIGVMLEKRNFNGKCADLNSLFVGLCRAAGVPAREMFGQRLLPSELSKSLGKAGDVSTSQHCRAEYLSARGWIPVDPADVRKAALEDGPDRLSKLRDKLFGFWEMNWVAFNSARDFALPPAFDGTVNYFMYPSLVSSGARNDGVDPKNFYKVEARLLDVQKG